MDFSVRLNYKGFQHCQVATGFFTAVRQPCARSGRDGGLQQGQRSTPGTEVHSRDRGLHQGQWSTAGTEVHTRDRGPQQGQRSAAGAAVYKERKEAALQRGWST